MEDPLDYVDRVNINTHGFPVVSHIVETAPFTGQRIIRICRCWQSRKFPYCDDTHKVLVQAGDNVGPYVAVIRGYQGPSFEQADLASQTAVQPGSSVGATVRRSAMRSRLGVMAMYGTVVCIGSLAGYWYTDQGSTRPQTKSNHGEPWMACKRLKALLVPWTE